MAKPKKKKKKHLQSKGIFDDNSSCALRSMRVCIHIKLQCFYFSNRRLFLGLILLMLKQNILDLQWHCRTYCIQACDMEKKLYLGLYVGDIIYFFFFSVCFKYHRTEFQRVTNLELKVKHSKSFWPKVPIPPCFSIYP